MAAVIIFRKTGTTPKVPSASALRDAERRMLLTARVKRPALWDFFAPSGRKRSAFHSLPALPSSVIDNPAARLLDHGSDGWIVPLDCLGRRGVADVSGGESVRAWIEKWIVSAGLVGPDEVAVVFERRLDQNGELNLD